MSGFLYFIRDLVTKPNENDLKLLGSDLVVGPISAVSCGPGGHSGMIFTINGRGSNIGGVGYFADKQTWFEFDNGRLWIGYYTNNKPKALDFAKVEQLPGHYVELGDGSAWLCPIARRFQEGSVLPATIMINSSGEYKLVTVDKYLPLQKDADRVNGIFHETEKFEDMNMQELYEIATRCLQMNYNISRLEVTVLRLITTVNVFEIVKSLLDVQSLEEDEKKTDHETIRN